MSLRKLPRSSMKAWAIGQLKSKQGGNCLVCGLPINLQLSGHKSDYVVDHCHETGQIRAILHRSCNSALGKVDNAAGRWGAKSMKYADIIPYLRRIVAYYEHCEQNPTGLIYPDHRSDEEKLELAKKRRREADARRRAKARMQELSGDKV